MSEQANAVMPVPEAAGMTADWETLLRAAPVARDHVEIPRDHLLSEAVSILTRQGWEVKVAMTHNAQLERRRPLRLAVGVALILTFSLVGMLLVMQQIANARRERVHLQMRDGRLQVLHAGRSITISDPSELEHLLQYSGIGMTHGLAIAVGLASLLLWGMALLAR